MESSIYTLIHVAVVALVSYALRVKRGPVNWVILFLGSMLAAIGIRGLESGAFVQYHGVASPMSGPFAGLASFVLILAGLRCIFTACGPASSDV
jgi:hypothetical protein